MPRVGFPGGPRLEWYDRNPSSASIYWRASNIAPHSLTTRATFTVPAGKKAFVSAAGAEVYRDGAPTTVGFAQVWIVVAANIQFSVTHRDATLGTPQRFATSLNAVLLAGQSAQILSADASTAGTMGYCTAIVIMEFDA